MSFSGNYRKSSILVLSLAALVTLVVSPLLGMKFIPFSILWEHDPTVMDWRIMRDIRLPRVLTGFIAGGGLALSGMVFQALFRNPLVSPYTLGVSSGASLGAILFIFIAPAVSFMGISGVTVSAFLGALVSIFLVYGLSRLKSDFSSATLLLAGVALNFFFSSLILLLQYIADYTQAFQMMRWLMGGLESSSYDTFFQILPFLVLGVLLIIFHRNELNLITAGEEIAMSRGLNVLRLHILLYVPVSLMIGGVVAYCGPISFVGLMVPHMARAITGPDHSYLAPATFLMGGVLLIFCDTLARMIIAPAEIPVGVITSFVGGPFFLVLLLRSARK